MGLRTPASWIQGGSHTAENDRLTERAEITAAGVVGTSDLAVSANGTPNMSVNVAAGAAVIKGSVTATQGYYKAVSDAVVNLAVTAADATNPRIDLVCLTVRDAQYAGANNDVILQVVAGTPAATPVAPATPANSYVLAQVAVAALAASITNGNITDKRARVRRGGLTLQAASSTDPVLTLFDESGNNVGGFDHLGNLTAPNVTSAWTAYTPSFTNFTLGNGTVSAKYRQIGKTVLLHLSITAGTTSSASGTVGISLPVAATGDPQYLVARTYNGSFYLCDGAVGTTNVTIDMPTSGSNSALVSWAGPIVGAALGTNMSVQASGSYEAA